MKMKHVAAAAALSLAMAGTASAQTPGSTQGGSTQRTPGATSGTDTSSQRQDPTARAGAKAMSSQEFVREAAVGGMAEVELGRLASERASNAEVKRFAQRMVTDHTKSNEELKSVAQRKNLTLPTDLDAEHKAKKDKLSRLNGAAFDRAYMDEMRADHRKNVETFRQQSRAGDDADVKAFAAKSLPTLEEHLQLAEKTHAAVGTSGSRDDDKPGATGTGGATVRPGDRERGTGTGTPGNTAPTPGTPGSPGTPGAGSDPRNQPGSVPGTGIQR